jgi:hypothetical protein
VHHGAARREAVRGDLLHHHLHAVLAELVQGASHRHFFAPWIRDVMHLCRTWKEGEEMQA